MKTTSSTRHVELLKMVIFQKKSAEKFHRVKNMLHLTQVFFLNLEFHKLLTKTSTGQPRSQDFFPFLNLGRREKVTGQCQGPFPTSPNLKKGKSPGNEVEYRYTNYNTIQFLQLHYSTYNTNTNATLLTRYSYTTKRYILYILH